MMYLKQVGALISTMVVDSSLPGPLLTDKVSYLTLMPSSVKGVNQSFPVLYFYADDAEGSQRAQTG